MIKFLPYWQYDVFAIENWLNNIAAQGYVLTSFGLSLCKFKRNEGNRVYYRVRYIDGNRDIGDAFWVGDLYVYHSENPNNLPRPNYNEDAKIFASKMGKPRSMIITTLMFLYLIVYFGTKFKNDIFQGDLMSSLAAIGLVTTYILSWLDAYLQWSRANHIRNNEITVTTHPPSKYVKIPLRVTQTICVILLILILANAYYYPSVTGFFP